MINYWKESGKDFSVGVGIYLDYGRNNRNIRSRLLKAKALGEKQISARARMRLDTEIQYIYQRYIGGHLNSKERKVEKEILKVAAKEVIKARELVDEEISLMGSVKNPYAVVTDAEILIFERKNLATKRALLTNKLKKDGGDQRVIDNNLAILQEMQPIIDKLKFVEKRLKAIEEGEVAQPQTLREKTDEKTVIIRLGYGRYYREYTYGDLIRMSLKETKALRKKMRDAKSKAKQRANPKNSRAPKNEKTRFRHEKEVVIKEKEIEMINIIISHKEERK